MKNVLNEQREALRNLLSEIDTFQIRIKGNSMYPTFSENDVVNIVKKSEMHLLEVGTVILFQRYNILVLHRIIKKSNDIYFVKGDNEEEVDIVRYKNIIGQVSSHIVEKLVTDKFKQETTNYIFQFFIDNNILESIEILPKLK